MPDRTRTPAATQHNREHLVLLRPGRFGLLVHTLFYADEALDEFRTETKWVARASPTPARKFRGKPLRTEARRLEDRIEVMERGAVGETGIILG